MNERYFVKVVRFRIEETTVEVKAVDHENAKAIAVDRALFEDCPKWKMRPFDEELYEPVAELCLSDHDFAAEGETPQEARKWLRSPDSYASYRYLFLRADVETGEGDLYAQPWLPTGNGLMMDDLCGDWGGLISRLTEDEDDEFEPPPGSGGNVMPFRRGGKADDDPPPSAA